MRPTELKELLPPGLMVLFLVLAWTAHGAAEGSLYAALAVLLGACSAHRYATQQQANEQE